MVAKLVHRVTVGLKNLGDEQTQFAIADHRDWRARWYRNLVQNLAGGSQRFSEYRAFCVDVLGNYVKISLGKYKELLKRAWLIDDAEHGAVGAMAAQVAATPIAIGAGHVDLTDDSLARERRCICFHHFGDELVSGIPAKP